MATYNLQMKVSDWVKEVEGAVEAIWKQSAQDVVNEAQTPRAAGGRMRVDTGFLRASIRGSTAVMPPINPSAYPEAASQYTFNDDDITAIIIAAKLGDTLYFGYTAAYAGHREYGSRGAPPDAFVRSAAQNWPKIVAKNEDHFMSRLKG